MTAPIEILVVEDNDSDAFILRRALSSHESDFKLHRTTRCSDALDILHHRSFDIILLDLSLPDSHGLETVRSIVKAQSGVPVIVLTGHDNDAAGLEAVKAGAQDYLIKNSIDSGEIVRSIRYALERKRTERYARERDSLKSALQAMEQVLAVVGHELRTPLAAVRATSEYLLSDGASPSADPRQFLQAIHDETVRMADLVSNLLEAARLNSGCVRWNWSSFDLQGGCEAAVKIVQPGASGRRLRIVTTVEPPDLSMCGDHDAIQRLIINLLNNAVAHTTSGTIAITARLSNEAEGSVEIEVTDTGEGIAPEIVGKLGQAFALSRGAIGADYVRGTGLGLMICKAIAAAHGGHIHVSSRLGEGSSFKVVLKAGLTGPVEAGDGGEILQEAAA